MMIKILLAVVILIMIYMVFVRNENMTMEINAEKFVQPNVNASNYIPGGVVISASQDPRFNFMTNRVPNDGINADIYALGQENQLWTQWRDPYVEQLVHKKPLDNVNSDIYSLGQRSNDWMTWRNEFGSEPESFMSKAKRWVKQTAVEKLSFLQTGWDKKPERPSKITPYGPIGMGTNQRSYIIANTAPAEMGPGNWTSEHMDNSNIFRGPPGYDITLTTNLSENLSNKSGWLTQKSNELLTEKTPEQIAADESKYVGILYNP
jgi:hypothetical protein